MSRAYCENRNCKRFYSGDIIGGVKGVVECHTGCGHVHIDEDGKCRSIILISQKERQQIIKRAEKTMLGFFEKH